MPSPQPARVTQFSPGRMRLVVRETLAELCRAMSSCAVVSDRRTVKGALLLSPSPPRIAPSQLRLVE